MLKKGKKSILYTGLKGIRLIMYRASGKMEVNMTKIDVFSGFLGAGKTTLIKKLIAEAYKGEKLVLIENEFGEIGIDGGFLKDAGIEITEMNSGCICCSLVGDFGTALQEVIERFHPDRILIEPSGVGKLSDVMTAVENVTDAEVVLNSATAVVDAKNALMYMKNFGEFFNNQIEHAGTIVLSRTDQMSAEKLDKLMVAIREHNHDAAVITTPWTEIQGAQILEAMEKGNSLLEDLMKDAIAHTHEHHHHHEHGEECGCGHHHEEEHHHHEHGEECSCGHHHDEEHHHHEHGEECGCGHHHEEEHHHHEHGEECGCGHHHEEEHHHHEHGEECGCGHHHEEEHHHHEHGEECSCGHHHDHHHADDVFTSWGVETPHIFAKDKLEAALKTLSSTEEYGKILRAKGMIPSEDGEWMYFDLVPGEYEIRTGQADYTGRLCVIGTDLKKDELVKLFEV